jgi:peptidoglycan/LPS O-acetylase OafA/YrhL
MQRCNRFEVLDSFRGLCALFVVIYHIHVTDSVAEIAFFRGSSVFVEFFFVLSGFVLAHGYAFRENLSFGPFLCARFFRLYPLHVFMLMVFILLEMGKWSALQFFGIGFNNVAFTNDYALESILPNLLLVHAWSPHTNPLSFNTPSWSISIEFYMYLLLYFSLLMVERFRVLIWVLIPFTMFYLMAIESDLLVPAVMRGLSGFFAGVICYLVYRRYISRIKLSRWLASLVEVMLILMVIAVVQSDVDHRSVWATLVFFIVVLWFSLERGLLSTVLKGSSLQFLGRLSYSIYMTHAAVIYLFTSCFLLLQKLIGKQTMSVIEGVRFFDSGYGLWNNLLVALMLASVLLCSCWTYRIIEVRGQALGKRLLRASTNSATGNQKAAPQIKTV